MFDSEWKHLTREGLMRLEPSGSRKKGTENRTENRIFTIMLPGTGTGTVKKKRLEPSKNRWNRNLFY